MKNSLIGIKNISFLIIYKKRSRFDKTKKDEKIIHILQKSTDKDEKSSLISELRTNQLTRIMSVLRKILKWLTAILVIFFIQTITFLTIAPKQLKNKLLPDSFIKNKFHSDSVFVRDYYSTDCSSGDFYVFSHSLNLKKYSDEIRKKLNVNFIHFSDEQIAFSLEEASDKYRFVYEVDARSRGRFSLFGFYDCRVCEFLSFEFRRYIKQRETRYRWFLFFWVKTSEHANSWENKLKSE